MKKLIELATILNRNKTKSISIIGTGSQTKLDKFYHLLADSKVTTDDEAFRKLYDNESQRNSYYKLKHQLKERLYNTIFFIDAKQNKFNNRKSAFLECQSCLCKANILNTLRAGRAAEDLYKKVLNIGSEYGFTTERLSAAIKLLNYYTVRGKIVESNKVIKLISAMIELQRKESYATLYWSKIITKHVKDRSVKAEIAQEAQGYLEKLDLINCDQPSQHLDYVNSALRMSVHMVQGHYDSAALVLEEALEKLSVHTHLENSFFISLSINLMACYIPLKRYLKGEVTIQNIYNRTENESFNWFKTREMHFILLLHTKRYQQASDLHKDTTKRKRFKKLPGYLQEIWIIYGAYLRILANAGHIEISATEKANIFRVTRYLNSLPTFSKDKRGQNIPVLISQIVLLLQQKKLDQIDDRFEAVGKYRSRYAGIEKNFRGNVFLHMIQQVTKNSFDRARIEKKTAHLYHLFSAVPIDITSQGYDQEILPYEDLWELLLDAL